MATGAQALTFVVAGERLAIPAGEIAEVIRAPAVSRVPLAPPSLAGIANLRGAVIPIVSLAALLGSADARRGERVIVLGGGSPVGLFVDHVSALVPLESARAGDDSIRLLDLGPLLDGAFSEARGGGRRSARHAAAAVAAVPPVAERAFFSFEIAEQEFALPLESVFEVIALPDTIAAVPETDAAMAGVITVRNRLLPLLWLPVLLGLQARPSDERRVVVAALGGTRAGLIVDRVKAIVRLPDADVDPVPPVLTRGRQEAQVRAIGRLEGGKRLISILSAEHLLKESAANRLRDSPVEEEVDMAEAEKGAVEQFVVFTLGDEAYGLPIDSVVEVVRVPERLTRLPKAPAFVEGILNLRGKIVPIIDQRRRFEAAGQAETRGRIVIVRIGDTEAGFVVDDVSEVLRVQRDHIRAAPEIGSGRIIDRIANIEAEGRMVLMVDPQELLEKAEQDLLAEMRKGAVTPS
ncbi:chemotaxis protein CheW [Sphingosinicella sp. BN140058]|uniref:chemotaxis protein CheW n=1 Tax=Sphingosinicella sp. BN140058 TaxID=1892855 RepID=UPI001012E57E|nr:chemotaxis protein CheW [Sphingosinicella sp. BN140058]QAY75901.1 chemotaxis protein CheW [Sphingosinicella sp. BN140058]